MATVKSRLLTIAGIAVGVLTVRRLRNRRSKTAEVEPIEIDQNPETAAEHATAAAEHARLAAEKAVKNRGEK